MISAFFNTIVYNPLYNGLIILMNAIPWADVGVVVIIFTIIVKLILFPLAQKSVKTQVAVRSIDPELKRIREKYKNKKEEQARKTMDLYKKHGINPFSGFVLILIQLPIIFALYFIFLRAGLPVINTEILYSFVTVPTSVDVEFLGILNVFDRSIVLALLTGISQYVQGKLVMPKPQPRKKGKALSLKDDMARSMQLQMRYVMPVIVGVIAYTLPAIVAIYWTTSNIFTIFQEIFVRKRFNKTPISQPDSSPAPVPESGS